MVCLERCTGCVLLSYFVCEKRERCFSRLSAHARDSESRPPSRVEPRARARAIRKIFL